MRGVALAGYLGIVAGLIAAPAAAQTSTGQSRYSFMQVEEGVLRLDNQTGEVSLCSVDAAAQSCAVVPEADRRRGEHALADRVTELEARIAALEAGRAGGGMPSDDAEALERVAVLSDRMLRNFFRLVRELRRETEADGE